MRYCRLAFCYHSLTSITRFAGAGAICQYGASLRQQPWRLRRQDQLLIDVVTILKQEVDFDTRCNNRTDTTTFTRLNNLSFSIFFLLYNPFASGTCHSPLLHLLSPHYGAEEQREQESREAQWSRNYTREPVALLTEAVRSTSVSMWIDVTNKLLER